jgi:hypothetical protein
MIDNIGLTPQGSLITRRDLVLYEISDNTFQLADNVAQSLTKASPNERIKHHIINMRRCQHTEEASYQSHQQGARGAFEFFQEFQFLRR